LLASKHTSIANPPGYTPEEEEVTLLLSAGGGADCEVGGAGGTGVLLSLSMSISNGASVVPLSAGLSVVAGGVDVLLAEPSPGVVVPSLTKHKDEGLALGGIHEITNLHLLSGRSSQRWAVAYYPPSYRWQAKQESMPQ